MSAIDKKELLSGVVKGDNVELKIEKLRKEYGDTVALDDISICFKEGLYGILGPNGAGKSTLMELLVDNLPRTCGEIFLDGVPILQMGKDYRKKVGYMPQQQCLYDHMTAREFLHYIGKLKGISNKTLRTESDELLQLVHLEKEADKYLGKFSCGMRQRVLLAQALLGQPDILILDEPTVGLDPKERKHVRTIMMEYAKKRIVLFVTHMVSDVEHIADQIIILKHGSIVRQGQPEILINELRTKVEQTNKLSLEDVYMYYFPETIS